MNTPERIDQSSSMERELVEMRKPLHGLHILVVDDSDSILMLIEQMLLSEGACCTLAESAEQAFKALKGSHVSIHAVLMDIQMPEVDGLQAIRQIRQDPRFTSLPLIAMTAGILQEQQVAARAVGANEIVHKPIRIDSLVQSILKWVRPRNGEKINIEHVTKTLGPDKAMLERLLQMFLHEHVNTVKQARTDLDNRNIKPAARRMHTLRGGAGQLGALDLQRAAQAAEQAILAGDPSINSQLAQVDEELRSLQLWWSMANAR